MQGAIFGQQQQWWHAGSSIQNMLPALLQVAPLLQVSPAILEQVLEGRTCTPLPLSLVAPGISCSCSLLPMAGVGQSSSGAPQKPATPRDSSSRGQVSPSSACFWSVGITLGEQQGPVVGRGNPLTSAIALYHAWHPA